MCNKCLIFGKIFNYNLQINIILCWLILSEIIIISIMYNTRMLEFDNGTNTIFKNTSVSFTNRTDLNDIYNTQQTNYYVHEIWCLILKILGYAVTHLSL